MIVCVYSSIHCFWMKASNKCYVIVLNTHSLAQGRQPRSFALDRMVDILEHNLPRARTFWPLFFEQLLCLARHSDPVERSSSMRVLRRAATTILQQAHALTATANDVSIVVINNSDGANGDDGMCGGAVSLAQQLEELVLGSLVDLRGAEGVVVDVRYASVDIALNLLQVRSLWCNLTTTNTMSKLNDRFTESCGPNNSCFLL